MKKITNLCKKKNRVKQHKPIGQNLQLRNQKHRYAFHQTRHSYHLPDHPCHTHQPYIHLQVHHHCNQTTILGENSQITEMMKQGETEQTKVSHIDLQHKQAKPTFRKPAI